MQKHIIIAIDGHSSCGKSTVAKQLAKHLSIAYVDTGAMYRSVTLFGMRNGFVTTGGVDEDKLVARLDEIEITFKYNPATGKNETYLNGENVEQQIRGLEVSNCVSPVAAIGAVRRKLVDLQRKMGQTTSLVMDGRDIGTVVFPDATLKLFMTASAQVRAERRYKELTEKGDVVDFADILKNVEERDRIDSTRAESPLRKADDAVLVDNSNMTHEEQYEYILKLVEQKCR